MSILALDDGKGPVPPGHRRDRARVGGLFGLGLLALVAGTCGGDPSYGSAGACDRPQGPLLGCPPAGADTQPFDEQAACWRLVRCGAIPLESKDSQDRHQNDWAVCVSTLAGFLPDREPAALRCIEDAPCSDLAAGFRSPCFRYGSKQP